VQPIRLATWTVVRRCSKLLAMFCELLGTYCVLRSWKENPSASKKDIGVWRHWREDIPENHVPLSPIDIEKMKAFVLRHNPSNATFLDEEQFKARHDGR